MAKRGEDTHEDDETKEEREARVDEMLNRARRAHRPATKKRAPGKPGRTKKVKHS